jgi:hypothetical protein
MVASLESLFETVDLTRIDRKLADAIEADLNRIKAEIVSQGYSDVRVDNKTFRVSKAKAEVAGAA